MIKWCFFSRLSKLHPQTLSDQLFYIIVNIIQWTSAKMKISFCIKQLSQCDFFLFQSDQHDHILSMIKLSQALSDQLFYIIINTILIQWTFAKARVSSCIKQCSDRLNFIPFCCFEKWRALVFVQQVHCCASFKQSIHIL